MNTITRLFPIVRRPRNRESRPMSARMIRSSAHIWCGATWAVLVIKAHATLDLGPRVVTVRFQKRDHKPLLLQAVFDLKQPAILWLENKKVPLVFG